MLFSIIIIVSVLVSGMISYGIYRSEKMKNRLKEFMTQINNYSSNKIGERQRKALYNYQMGLERRKFINYLDQLMVETGLYEKFKISGEIYIILLFIVWLYIVLTAGLFGNMILGLMAGCAFVGTIHSLFYILAGQHYKKIESQLMNFLDVADSYSICSDDIIEIMKKTADHMQNPLKMLLLEFCSEIEITGDITSAVCNLERKVSHEKFKEIIENLNVCRRYEANYSQILGDMRQSLNEYLFAKKNRHAIRKQAHLSMAMILGVGILIMNMLGGMLGENIIILLLKNVFGVGILLYLAILIILLICSFFKVERG